MRKKPSPDWRVGLYFYSPILKSEFCSHFPSWQVVICTPVYDVVSLYNRTFSIRITCSDYGNLSLYVPFLPKKKIYICVCPYMYCGIVTVWLPKVCCVLITLQSEKTPTSSLTQTPTEVRQNFQTITYFHRLFFFPSDYWSCAM
jgi:hypothetical protein